MSEKNNSSTTRNWAQTLVQVFQKRNKILEGIYNYYFPRAYIESIARKRLTICQSCDHYDTRGTGCAIPGTHPCCDMCGCSHKFLLRSLSSSCEDGRWQAEMSQEAEDSYREKHNINE